MQTLIDQPDREIGEPPGRVIQPRAIEPWSNRVLIHPAAEALVGPAIASRISPNMVTLAGLGFGLMAAFAYSRWAEPMLALAGFLLMLGWHVLDGLDGKLARATGRASATGRLLDGVADHLVFVAVYAALAFSFDPPWTMVAVAFAAGGAHAVQAAFYEAQRETWIRRSAGSFAARPRSRAGGPFEAFYNAAERLLGNRTTPLDRRLSNLAPPQRAALLAEWQQQAARQLRLMSPLSANGRTLAIFLACVAGSPVWFWLWELVALSLLALGGAIGAARLERRLVDAAGQGIGEGLAEA
jgi:CDP-diacylglycerol--serine O-phosphatidyltransferase